MRSLPPLAFKPIFKEKVWGGRKLAAVLGKQLPPDVSVGESWEISGYGDDISTATSPEVAGCGLDRLVEQWGEALVGAGSARAEFPLLVKLIDAADRLSVQVHPDDAQARRHGWGNFGKTECWYVVDAEPGAGIIVGFTRPVEPTEVEGHIRAGTLEQLLNTIPVRPGDVLLIPGGTVHAILGGTLLYELQETSDTTLRFYDWGRNDPARPLHIRDSLQVADLSLRPAPVIRPVVLSSGRGATCRLRVACRHFALSEWDVKRGERAVLPPRRSFQVLTVLRGTAQVEADSGSARAGIGDSILLPASAGEIRVSGEEDTRFLRAWVPELATEIVGALRERGVPRERIVQLGGNIPANDLTACID